jgi:hypothetical protein
VRVWSFRTLEIAPSEPIVIDKTAVDITFRDFPGSLNNLCARGFTFVTYLFWQS